MTGEATPTASTRLFDEIANLERLTRDYLRSANVGRTAEQRYAVAWRAAKDLKEIVALLEDETKALNEPLTEQFIAEDKERTRLLGVTLYLERMLWAGKGDSVSGGQLASTLEELNLDDFLTVNASTISAWVRELARQATGKEHPTAEEAIAALPKPLQGLLKVTEQVNMRGRRTS